MPSDKKRLETPGVGLGIFSRGHWAPTKRANFWLKF